MSKERIEQIRHQQRARRARLQSGPIAEAMAEVRHKVAIISGKGGVGKTSLTINLGATLQEMGYKVGVFDADIHGPTVPKMLGIEAGPDLMHGAFHLDPLTSQEGMKVMSVALIWPGEDTPTMWRGSYKMKVIRQFLSAAVWEELDYLLIDLPPGTGDEVLAIMESIPHMDGVVAVSTPDEVSTSVCGKAINTARELDVPVLGLVENMGWLRCPHCSREIDLFGREDDGTGGEAFAQALGIRFLGSIPFDLRIRQAASSGVSTVSEYPKSEAVDALRTIAERLAALLGTPA